MSDNALKPGLSVLSDSDIYNACLSYRHDFGLMGPEERNALVLQAREWARAFGHAVTDVRPQEQAGAEKLAASVAELLSIPYPEGVPEVSGRFRGSVPFTQSVVKPVQEDLDTVMPPTDPVSVPWEWLQSVAGLPCPESFGFEGAGTFPDCGDCVVCRARARVQAGQGAVPLSVPALPGSERLSQVLAALESPPSNPELRHAFIQMAIETVRSTIEASRHAVLFSVTCDGQHTGDIYPTYAQAEIASRSSDRWYPKGNRVVVPLYAAPALNHASSKTGAPE